jgi:hypothetical protein
MKQRMATEKTDPLLFKFSSGIFFLLITLLIFVGYKSKGIVFAQESNYQELEAIYRLLDIPDPHIEKISTGPKLVTVQRGKEVKKVLTTSNDIRYIINQSGLEYTDSDLIYLNTDYLLDGAIIRIIRTESIVVEEFVDIPYETETRETSKYQKGYENILQSGVLGIKRQRVLLYYEEGQLVSKEVLGEAIEAHPQKEIVEIGTAWYSLEGIEIRGYNCPYWYSVVDSGPYSEEEKRWLKFIMYCESGCNAESNKSSYKGLFQWSPYWWRKQFSENIFDGHAQIIRTVGKYRAGESTRASQWPACHSKYVRTYGSN